MKQGFIWLRQACEIAVGEFEELQSLPSGEKEASAKISSMAEGALKGVKAELVLAIYEVGQCFFQGWGVTRDRTMGFVRVSCVMILLAFTMVSELLPSGSSFGRCRCSTGTGLLLF